MSTQATDSPSEALAWITAGERFDAAILDLLMPGMDGASLAAELRTLPAGRELPLILFSSVSRRELRNGSELFEAQLSKPLKPSSLLDALLQIFETRGASDARSAPLARPIGTHQAPSRSPLRVLLAEDNAVNQKLAVRLLEKLGYRADVAADGREAIESLERQRYDVVLMDVQMPELDGLAATREIVARWPAGQRPRIVAMTANAMAGDREECLAAGMDDYLSKPIRPDELAAALERVPGPGGQT